MEELNTSLIPKQTTKKSTDKFHYKGYKIKKGLNCPSFTFYYVSIRLKRTLVQDTTLFGINKKGA
jgi:hypothetical protein